MSEQLIVNVTPFETRVAQVESGLVTEVFIERHRDRGTVGNIYVGKVQRVLPGMQAAFVEIGTERAAFLYVGDVVPPHDDDDDEDDEDDEDDQAQETASEDSKVEGSSSAHAAPGEPSADGADRNADANGAPMVADLAPRPDSSAGEDDGEASADKSIRPHHRRHRARSTRKIEELLKPGQKVLVQVAKDAISTKGPRVTCNISLPGRHLVYMPTHRHLGISRRIVDEEERDRLRQILDGMRPESGGFVVRTVSEGLSEEKLKADVDFLVSMWADVQSRAEKLSAPNLVQPELNIVLRCARDQFTTGIERFVVDNEKTFEEVKKFVSLLEPALADRVEFYQGAEPAFDYFGVETELARAMSRRVWLKSGGYLVIDQAEALTAIDVNTGRFVGKRNLEDTILRTNLEAVREVAYQLRLRNLGGMVIIDFIDMEAQEHRDKVLNALNEALKKDKARCNVIKISEIGLVEMTRQRTRESLGRQLTETCWYCEGRGSVKSKRTVVYEIFRALERQAARFTEPVVVIHAHPEVVDAIYDEESDFLQSIEQSAKRTVVVRPRGSFHQEQFDIFGTSSEAARPELKGKRRRRRGAK